MIEYDNARGMDYPKETSILVLCLDTVKEPAASSAIRVYKAAILLHKYFRLHL